MSSIVSYQFTSSDESSSDEDSQNQNAEFIHDHFNLTGVPLKKFCPEQQEETDSTPNAEEPKGDEEQQQLPTSELPTSETEDEINEQQQENEEIEGHEMQGDYDHSPHLTRKQSYALDQKELPGEMQTFLREVKRFFTRQVNLERQAKPLAMSTYRKAQERILCKSFRS